MHWADYIMKDVTLQTQHNINITGGTDKVRYFISAGAYTQGGLFNEFNLPYNVSYQYRRFNYRSNLDIDVTKTTTLSFNIGGNVNNADKPYTGQGSAGMIKNMYYATPFSSAGIVDGNLLLQLQIILMFNFRLRVAQVWHIMELDLCRQTITP